MAIDIKSIMERIKREQERQREALAWFERRNTWAPVLTDEQKREHEEQVKKYNLPF